MSAPPHDFMPPPPPPGFIPPPPPPPYNAGTQNVVIVSPNFDSEPQRLTCPYCHENIVTSVDTATTTKTHLFALLLCLAGCWICAPCPYCIDSCLAKKHYCPMCKSYIGESHN